MAKQADPAVEMLSSIDIFCGLDESHLAMIRQAARDHTFMAGQPVVEEGGADKRMYVILAGNADVLIAGDDRCPPRAGRLLRRDRRVRRR